MVDVAHKNLTGVDLHEPKGVSGASAGDVYIADGASSGAWAPKGPQVALYHDIASDANNHIALTTGAWTKVALDVEAFDPDSIGSLSSNAVTLGAGTYFFKGRMAIQNGSATGGARLRVYNTTDGSATGLSMSVRFQSADDNPSIIEVSCGETIASNKTYELQYYTNTPGASPLNDSLTVGNEIWAEFEIWKLK